eukprot:jgi/Ulvmu1/3275/UM151_0023.1
MGEHSKVCETRDLADYIRFLRSSGFPDAAAKLELEFDPAPEAQKRGLSLETTQGDQALNVKEQDQSGTLERLRHCSTSSLESCGAVSGPIASSCPSQFASPSHAVGAGLLDNGGRAAASVPIAPSSSHKRQASASLGNAVSAADPDQGFSRIPVANQAWFEANELSTVVGEQASRSRGATRRSPQQTLPHGYFHRGSIEDPFPVNSLSAPGQPASLKTQLPPALARLASQSPTHVLPSPARRSLSESPHTFNLSTSDADPFTAPSPRPSSAIQDSTPTEAPSFATPPIPKSPSAGRMYSVSHSAGGVQSAAPSHRRSVGQRCSASVSTTSGADGAVATSYSVGTGLRQGASWLGSHDSLRRSATDDSPLLGDPVADVNDPPDAPEDAAVFMHDISHSAWHQFTRHVAKEAASISGSSFYTAHAVDHHGAEAASLQPATPHTVHSMTSYAPSWTDRAPESPTSHARFTASSTGGPTGPSSPPSMHALTSPFHTAYPAPASPLASGYAPLQPPSSAPAAMSMPPTLGHQSDALRWPPSPGRLSPASSTPPRMQQQLSDAPALMPEYKSPSPAHMPPVGVKQGATVLPPLALPRLSRSSGDGSGEPQVSGSAEIATAEGQLSQHGSCAESVSVAGYSHDSSGECSIIVRDPGSLDPSPGAEILPDTAELELERQDNVVTGDSFAQEPRPHAGRQLSSSTKASSIRREASLCMDPGMVPSCMSSSPGGSGVASGQAAGDVHAAELQPALTVHPDATDPADAAPVSPGQSGSAGGGADNTFTAWRSVSAPLQEARSLLLGAATPGWEAAAALHAIESAPPAAGAAVAMAEPSRRPEPLAIPSGELLQPLLLGAAVQPLHRSSLDRLPNEALATSPVLSAASPFHYSPVTGEGALGIPSSRTETAEIVFGNIGEPGQRGPRRNLTQEFLPGSPQPAGIAAAAAADREDGQPGQDNMCSVGSLITLPDTAASSASGVHIGLDAPAKEYSRAPSFGIDIVRKGSSSQSTVSEEEGSSGSSEDASVEEEGDLDVMLSVDELPQSREQQQADESGLRPAAASSVAQSSGSAQRPSCGTSEQSTLVAVPSAAGTSLAGTLTFASDTRPSLAPSSPQAPSSVGDAALPPYHAARTAGAAGDGRACPAVRASSAGHEADDEGGSECGSIGSGDFAPLRGSAVGKRSAGPGLLWRPDRGHIRTQSAFVGSETITPWFRREPQMHKSLTLRGDADSHSLPQPDLDLGAQSLLPAAADSPPMPLFAGGGNGSASGHALAPELSTASRTVPSSTAVTSADTNTRTAAGNSTGFFTWDSTALTSHRASSDSLSSAVSVSSGVPNSPLPDCSSPLDPFTDVLAHTIGSVFDSSSQRLPLLPAPNDSEPSAFDLTEYEADSDTELAAGASVCLLDLSPPGSVAMSATPAPAAGTPTARDSAAADDSTAAQESPTSATLQNLVRPATAPAPAPTAAPQTRHSSAELAASSDLGSRSGSLAAPDLGAALISPRRGPAWSAPAPIPSMQSPLAPLPPSPPLPPATSDKGFLLLDDKFPESDHTASPLAAESSCATAAQDMDFRLHPFAAASASLATSVTDADSGALWPQTEPSDSSPLRQPNPADNLSTHYSSTSGHTSTNLPPAEPSDSHARPDSISILEPVEPLLSRRSSSANPASPACGVGAWAIPARPTTTSFPPTSPPPPRPSRRPPAPRSSRSSPPHL